MFCSRLGYFIAIMTCTRIISDHQLTNPYEQKFSPRISQRSSKSCRLSKGEQSSYLGYYILGNSQISTAHSHISQSNQNGKIKQNFAILQRVSAGGGREMSEENEFLYFNTYFFCRKLFEYVMFLCPP